MNHLEDYFQNEFNIDFSELQDVDTLLGKILPDFINTFDEEKSSWPYSKSAGKEQDKNKPLDEGGKTDSCSEKANTEQDEDESYSFSTNSMILNMMFMALEKATRGTLFPKFIAENIISKILKDSEGKWIKITKKGLSKYIEQVCSKIKKNGEITYSRTYGHNDPLSLFWCNGLVEVEKRNNPHNPSLGTIEQKIKEIATEFREKFKRICNQFSCEENTPIAILDFGDNQSKYQQNIHPFLVLRLLYLELELFKNDQKHSIYKNDFFRFFERKLHLQLSYNDIPDSRFDPAELVLSLEGALLSGGDNSVSDQTIERAFHVIEKYQDATPYWRPVNPLYATPQGQILLPLSVEVANSLLRICVKRDDIAQKESPFSKHASLFKRYFQWLKARVRQIPKTDTDSNVYFGWESEHVGSEKKIDMFQTSEIACFLINYRHMLQDRIARRSLAVSGLQVDWSTMTKRIDSESSSDYWDKNIGNQESLLELDEDCEYRIFSHIKKSFILPREKNELEDAKYSMLLYGPPGTGKTTVAEKLAESLKWKLITITPSDFLAGGSGEVEARAKAIFRCLNEQKDGVILFDEIDHFLLDRESKEYQNQQGIFQFMTPGMLPKIKKLHDNKRSIFIIATNYEERIDPAIKRKGRIDISCALMPPAFKQRYKIINNILSKKTVTGSSKIARRVIDNFINYFCQKTNLCTYTDIATISDKISKNFTADQLNKLMEPSQIPTPSITTQAYHSKFFEPTSNSGKDDPKNIEKTPLIEFFLACLIKYQKNNKFSIPKTISSEDRSIIRLYKTKKDFKLNCTQLQDLFKKLLQEKNHSKTKK